MKFAASALLLAATAALVDASSSTWSKSPQAIRELYSKFRAERAAKNIEHSVRTSLARRRPATDSKKFKYLNRSTKQFWVNGTAGAIPDVHFDVPESYAGLLPISTDKDESRKLSLEGFLQENGPFTWKYGTYLPESNKYTWLNLTNMIWVEQPVGTGFSQGTPNVENQEDVAKQFLGFFRNFVNKFNLHNKRIWITGESYAGKYIPYIADAMYNAKNTRDFDIKGTMMYDPSIDEDLIMDEAPALPFVIKNNAIFNFGDDTLAALNKTATDCGYWDLYNEGLHYPPKGLLKAPSQKCKTDIWQDITNAAMQINPCFNIYHITDTCPLLWDVLGFPGSSGYLPDGAKIYFQRPEVQKAINAPAIGEKWEECTNTEVFPHHDKSPYPIPAGVMARIIEKSERTIIAHGLHDFILLADGSRIAIQNMTWGGQQGFQSPPSKKFMVPYEDQGELGVWHTERKLTYVEIKLSGHMVPQYQPGAAYRHIEYLLGRVKDLS
ncbi:hypothetical protein ABW21_db0207967 [Orbilia brochopaga]|nr:hypothetical protein ABW21_db0207967 [Drechslerella brochopaga]